MTSAAPAVSTETTITQLDAETNGVQPADGQKDSGRGVPADPYDRGLLIVVMLLVGFGLVMVYSASIGVADMRYGDPSRYLRSHLFHTVLAVGALALGMTLHYRSLERYVYWILAASLVFLVLLTVGFGVTLNYATRWLGPSWLRFQPSEVAKLAFVIYLAYSLSKKHEQMRSFAIGFLPHLIVCCVIMFLCLTQPDLGTCILLSLLMFVMLFVGGTRLSYITGVLIVTVPLAATYIASSSEKMQRILAWLDPWADRLDTGYQTVNALTSLGSGEWFGLGLGSGRQKMGFVPESWTDFIFASIGEELGLIGCAAVVIAFVYLCWRGLRIAWRTEDNFGRYLAFGITALIGIQAAFNMGVAVGLLPTKGLTLPFISGGGTALVVCCFAAGVLLNISKGADGRVPARSPVRQGRGKPTLSGPSSRRPERRARKPLKQHDSGVRVFVRDGGRR